MTTETNKTVKPSFSIRNVELIDKIKTAMELHNIKSNGEFMETTLNLLPLLNVIQAKGLTIEQAIDRLNRGENVVTIVKTVRKGANEAPFNALLNLIISYNLECNDQQFKIALTPSVFYKILKGNVKAIETLFDSNIDIINKHNTDMGLDNKDDGKTNNWNRKLAKRIEKRTEDNSYLYIWIKKTVGYDA